MHIDVVKPHAVNYVETFSDYILDVSSGRLETRPFDIMMTGTAINLSPVMQSVTVSWSRVTSESTHWKIAHSQFITAATPLSLGIPVLGHSVSFSSTTKIAEAFNDGQGINKATTLNVRNTFKVPPFSMMHGWVAAQQGKLTGARFSIKYNRHILSSPPMTVSFWLNGTWDVVSYLDARVCWSPIQSVFNATAIVTGNCSLPSFGPLDERWKPLARADATSTVAATATAVL
ncbi:hypothetical protein SeLEV6574_g02140 [Synchytrium endobioticum]|uniref:Uncharacterized protein n=2 Tax=Synchytrium endobioticum TaxID=286115 RepID=A0A507D9D9_9FUNG|nr:hypothetical protein SeLEV6574_g02140 [Synchytrium endobioticum]